MIWARNIENGTFYVDSKHVCDHLVKASTRIMKYRNDPHGGCIGPQISPCILCKNDGDSVITLEIDGLVISFPCEQALHG